jgi:hypothetical protein
MLFTEDLMIHSTPNLDVDGTCYVPDRKCSFGARNGKLELVYEFGIDSVTYACFRRKQKLKKTKWTEVGSINGWKGCNGSQLMAVVLRLLNSKISSCYQSEHRRQTHTKLAQWYHSVSDTS